MVEAVILEDVVAEVMVVTKTAGVTDKWELLQCNDIPWFHGIINTFSLSLVCPKAFFVLILI